MVVKKRNIKKTPNSKYYNPLLLQNVHVIVNLLLFVANAALKLVPVKT